MSTDAIAYPTMSPADALYAAAASAGYAPSIHNTQPWRWRVLHDRLELLADRGRQLAATDPDGRLLTLSCGAALHHVRLALAAVGLAADIHHFPAGEAADLLATVLVTGQVPVTAEAMRRVQAMRLRRTDRRPVSDQPIPPAVLDAIVDSVDGLARLEILKPDQVYDLAAAEGRAGVVEADDPGIARELAYWTSREAPHGTGLPPEVVPADRTPTTVPARDFGRPGALAVGPGHDRAARYVVLHGDADGPEAWLSAGEALAAAWLAATELGVSVVPLSGAVEVTFTRQALRVMLSGLGYPYLAMRLGFVDAEHPGPPHTPRLPTAQVVDTEAVRPATIPAWPSSPTDTQAGRRRPSA